MDLARPQRVLEDRSGLEMATLDLVGLSLWQWMVKALAGQTA